MASQKQLDQAVTKVAELAHELYEGTAQSLTVDIGAAGEHPYRVVVPDEPLPLIGMAVGDPLPFTDAISSRA
jgi:hypothetical protein